VAQKYSYNGSTLLANNQAILFMPVSVGVTNRPPTPVTLSNARWVGGRFAVSFLSEVNANYAVQVAPSLAPPNWQTWTNVTGTGSILSVTNGNPPAAARFYRVESQSRSVAQ
jgi:hypothetical protein